MRKKRQLRRKKIEVIHIIRCRRFAITNKFTELEKLNFFPHYLSLNFNFLSHVVCSLKWKMDLRNRAKLTTSEVLVIHNFSKII